MYRAALFTITKRWNEDKDSVTDEWIKKIHTYMYYVHQMWPLWCISQLFVTPWTAARQASLSSPSPGTCSNSRPLSWWSIQPSHPLLSPSPVFNLSQHQDLSSESALRIRWPKYWSFSLILSPSNEHPGLISFRMDWLDLLAVQRTLKSLLQHHSSKASILRRSAFFTVQLSHPYMTTGNHSLD